MHKTRVLLLGLLMILGCKHSPEQVDLSVRSEGNDLSIDWPANEVFSRLEVLERTDCEVAYNASSRHNLSVWALHDSGGGGRTNEVLDARIESGVRYGDLPEYAPDPTAPIIATAKVPLRPLFPDKHYWFVGEHFTSTKLIVWGTTCQTGLDVNPAAEVCSACGSDEDCFVEAILGPLYFSDERTIVANFTTNDDGTVAPIYAACGRGALRGDPLVEEIVARESFEINGVTQVHQIVRTLD